MRASHPRRKSAGIPVIGDYSFDCDNNKLFAASTQMTSAHPDIRDWLTAYGAAKADWLIKATDGKAKVITSDLRNSLTATMPQAGFDAELKAKCPGYSSAYAKKFSSVLVAHPDANSTAVPLAHSA